MSTYDGPTTSSFQTCVKSVLKHTILCKPIKRNTTPVKCYVDPTPSYERLHKSVVALMAVIPL